MNLDSEKRILISLILYYFPRRMGEVRYEIDEITREETQVVFVTDERCFLDIC